ncbi:LIMLP_03685 family anti-sigma factor [Leptospira kirschneri]|uniref:LIMLP_03685 family anti-sigma factor n=1 Tax=Leptospira kirschneri TaxID=29507 RepID=UPI003565053B
MKTELDDIERFEDLLGRYLYGELNTEDKRELLQFVLKNEKARSMYQNSTRTNSILSRTFSDIKQTPYLKSSIQKKILEFPNTILKSRSLILGLTAAMLFLVVGVSFWFKYQFESDSKLSQAFINSYGDCKIDGVASQPGESLLNRKLVSGNFSICEFQVEGAQSVAVRMLPDSEVSISGNKKYSSLNVARGSILVDSIQNESTGEGLLAILSPDVRAFLAGTKVIYSRNVGESYSKLDIDVLDGKVEVETGPLIAFEKTASTLTKEEKEFLKMNFPILFQSKKVQVNRGQSLSWKGIPESSLNKIRSLEKSIGEAKSQGLKLEENFVFALNSDVRRLGDENTIGMFSMEDDLNKKIKNILPNQEKELEEKFKSMVRFAPNDLKQVEKLKSLVAKLDNKSLIQILKDKNQPDHERVIHFKDGSQVKGFIYQHESFYILLKNDGNLLFPIDAVDSIHFE